MLVRGLQEEARREKLAIHVGVHEPGLDANRVKNTVLWINEKGEIAHRYQKIHLFDVNIKDGPVLKESKCVAFFFSAVLLFSVWTDAFHFDQFGRTRTADRAPISDCTGEGGLHHMF